MDNPAFEYAELAEAPHLELHTMCTIQEAPTEAEVNDDPEWNEPARIRLCTDRPTVESHMWESCSSRSGANEQINPQGGIVTDGQGDESKEESPLRRFLSQQVFRGFSKKISQVARAGTHAERIPHTNGIDRTRRRLTKQWIHSSDFHLPEMPDTEDERKTSGRTTTFNLDERLGTQLPSSSRSSADSVNDEDTDKWERPNSEVKWINNKEAKSSMITALTAFYCLFLTIFALVLELSHLLSGEEERKLNIKDWIFGLYMYGCGILFFFYMYVVLLLNPRWYSAVFVLKRIFGSTRSSDSSRESTVESAAATVRKVSHTSPSAGSLFLRLGAVVFGVVGVVYYSFLVFLCFSDQGCSRLSAGLDICAIIFIFTQMHFVFCNWKLTIGGAHNVSRLGTMHLIAANLWTWIRYVLMEEGFMEKEIREVFNTMNSKAGMQSSEEHSAEAEVTGVDESHPCRAAECILGSLSELMYTAIVEYSLIGAAVMFIVWRNIGVESSTTQYVKRKHQIRVDCSKTTTGLFLGLAFLAATFTSMVVYYGYSTLGKSKKAAFVYAFTDIVQYVCSSVGCAVAIFQMRRLEYHSQHAKDGQTKNNRPTELLDQMLLCMGLIGELIYSVAGLVGLTGDSSWQPLAFVLLFVHICRLIQVGLQTFLIYMAGRVRVSHADRITQPGKQAVTFLLVANVAIFFMNLFESEKAGVSEIIIDFYGKRSWVFLVRSFSPLTIFYRFHSSVCLAEIWKNVYARKD